MKSRLLRPARRPAPPRRELVSATTIDTPLDVEAIRRDFPILETTLAEGYPLAYLDNGASTQRPRQVIASMVEAYEHYYSNVHRGGHALAAESTVRYEAAREAVRALINARSTTEIIFCSGTTAAINLVARSYGDANLRPGDEILLTEMEHHSNIVPWQQAAERTGAVIRWAPITDGYELDMPAFERLLTQRTKIVAVTAMSNVLGTINPIGQIVRLAHAVGAVVLVDAAQSVPHEPIDVRAWDADFLAFSGHKMLGPSGVGVLYGRENLLDAMPPFLGGGSMIKTRHARWLHAGRSAVQVRGRHADDRRGDRPGQGDRLPAGDWARQSPAARPGSHAPGPRAAGRDSRPADPRPRARAKRGPRVVCAGRGPSARSLQAARPARDRHPRRPPLRDAAAQAAGDLGQQPGELLSLQHAGRSGAIGHGPARCAAGLSAVGCTS